MRVIAGERRGFRLETPPKQEKTRPTEDRLKEAVFSILQPLKQGCVVFDAFAGTGQIGIEFLSRGAARVLFCEKNPNMVQLIQRNLQKTKYEEQSFVFRGDARRALGDISETFDYVYLDPPFHSGMDRKVLEMLRRTKRLNSQAKIIVESSSEDSSWEAVEGYEKIFDRLYGTKRIRIFQEAV